MRLTLILTLIFSFLSAQPREALLIGNYSYKHITNLNNPSENLKRLKKSLEDVDFNVEIKQNLNSENLEDAIVKFTARLARNRDTIGFLYYTGHGCQVDYQGYLVPTNVDTTKKLKIKYNALNINQMLETLKTAKNKVNLLFLDACRDVPTGTKGGTKGLGQPIEKPIGTLLVYATEAGKVANDNAKFINALIENINRPNQQIEKLGVNISRVVAKKTNYHQVPEVYAKLLPENMVLKGGYVPPPPPTPTPVYIPKPKPISTSKWITPSDSVCKANGGKMDAYGICQSNWENAKKICSANGGQLPSIDDLKQVVVDCGGEWDNWSKNNKNTYYQPCYKQKGFNDFSLYWSSTSSSYYNESAYIVYFYGGTLNNGVKGNNYYVRCVRAGQ